MFISRLSRVGTWMVKDLCKGKYKSVSRMDRPYYQCLQHLRHHSFSTTAAENDSCQEDEDSEKISVIFIDRGGKEHHIKVPIGMTMLEAAHKNDIELEGACSQMISCSTCHVIVNEMEYYNKLEEPSIKEDDMLDMAFGLTETSRLGCQVKAKAELDGIRLVIPSATRNFAVDGFFPKPH